jgi:hypothetical protein
MGDTNVTFVIQMRWVAHLFLSCPFARHVWQIVHLTCNISPPTNITNMFGIGLMVLMQKKSIICIGVSPLYWSIWNCSNSIVFNRIWASTIFAGYPLWCALDTTMATLSSVQQQGLYRYWMQSTANGCSGFLQRCSLATF